MAYTGPMEKSPAFTEEELVLVRLAAARGAAEHRAGLGRTDIAAIASQITAEVAERLAARDRDRAR